MEANLIEQARPPQSEFSRRLKNIRSRMKEREIDILVIFSGPGSLRFGQRGHVMYVSGYEAYFGDTMVILPQDENLETLLELGEAHNPASDCTWIKTIKDSIDHVNILKEYLRDHKLENRKIGIAGEYSMSPSLYARFQEEIGPDRIEVASDIIEVERTIKSEYEIGCMREAARIAKKGIEAAVKFARPGVLEAEIIGEIERVCRIEGSQFFPHYTMVISGMDANYVRWWWRCSQRRLEERDPWLVDFGTMYKGYCCDISRTFVLGSASQAQKETFEVLRRAQEAAKNTAKAGVLASEVNKASSDVMKEAWGKESWAVGHGVGLEVHEWPFVGYHRITHNEAYKDTMLKENMVISLEPAIYIPDIGIQQIEDQFLVTKTGSERLNDIPQEIMECQ